MRHNLLLIRLEIKKRETPNVDKEQENTRGVITKQGFWKLTGRIRQSCEDSHGRITSIAPSQEGMRVQRKVHQDHSKKHPRSVSRSYGAAISQKDQQPPRSNG
jgi:hypothetical protein